jgi:hypothetical protein
MSRVDKIEGIALYASNVCSMVIAIAIFLVVGHYAIGFASFIMMSTIGDPREDSPVYQDYPDRPPFCVYGFCLATIPYHISEDAFAIP